MYFDNIIINFHIYNFYDGTNLIKYCIILVSNSHLLDLLHEQEKSTTINGEANNSNLKYKDDREINDISSVNEEEASIKRWRTEGNLSGSIVLERKTQSLADFTQSNFFFK